MTAEKNIEANLYTPEQRASLLQDGLIAVITGSRMAERYIDRQKIFWGKGNLEYVLESAGVRAPVTSTSIVFDAGSGYGNLSGIIPRARYIDPETDSFRHMSLTVDADLTPNFRVLANETV